MIYAIHGLRGTIVCIACLYRDILAFKEDGGWATMGIVARYAKKTPDAYREEIRAWWGLSERHGSGTDIAAK